MSARYRGNLALYANYAGDFQTAENEANGAPEATDLTTIAVAFAQLGQGRLLEARATYEKLRTLTARGASWSASGLADVALYQGQRAGAARLFELGAEADLAAKNSDRAARKLTSLAQVQLLRGEQRAAIATAEKALATSKALPIRFLAARIFAEANELAKARELAKPLAAELAAEPQAYGKIIEGEIALKSGGARDAIKILTEANTILDTWLGRFALGRAYLEAGAYLQADSEFDRCVKRRGETLSLLLDEEPTYGHFPVVYYYQGRVREALKNPGSAESYGEYLKIRGNSTEDPLVPEIKKRLAGS
jgi:eukaryotic-like serine/threonine-protein kinase